MMQFKSPGHNTDNCVWIIKEIYKNKNMDKWYDLR